MKKYFFTVAILAIAAMASAQTITAAFDMKMLGIPSGTPDELHLYQIVEASATSFDNEYESTKLMNTSIPTSVNIYVTTSYGKLSDVALPDFLGLPITIQTNNTETEYSFTFSNVEGDVKFLDAELDSVFDITENLVYNFTTPLGKKVYDNRFFIYKPFTPDAGELAVCVYYNSIEITNNPYTDNIVVKDMEGNVVLTKAPRATPQVISLENLASGHYFLEIGTESFEFFNKPEAK